MEFRIADTFTNSLARLTGQEQKAVKTTAFDLQMDPSRPGMQFHRIDRSKDDHFWSVRVSRDLRLIVHKTSRSFLLCYAGHHDDAYAWAERRKIERHPKTGAAQLVEVRETIREVPTYVTVEQPVPPALSLFDDVSNEDVQVGTAPGGSDVMSAQADPATGRALLPGPGNVRQNTAWALYGLVEGTYYWSVQAVDAASVRSPFAQGSFTVSRSRRRAFRLTDAGLLEGGDWSFTRSRTDDLNGAWGDYDSDGDLDLVLLGGTNWEEDARLYRNDGGTFTDVGAGLVKVRAGAAAWGDYDGDGDLDLALTGASSDGLYSTAHIKLYRNDGGAFADVETDLEAVAGSDIDWGDYDGDGDLDLLLVKNDRSGGAARVYRNDEGRFSDAEVHLQDYAPNVRWVDFDGDGDLDVHSGALFRNSGGFFTRVESPFAGKSTAAWGDYDGDGDLDVITGSKLFRNEGGTFPGEGEKVIDGIPYAQASGDYDNDGDLDLLVTGTAASYNTPFTRLYENDGKARFTPLSATGLREVTSHLASWADYDGDGDLDILTGTGYGAAAIYRNDGGFPNTPLEAPGRLVADVQGATATLWASGFPPLWRRAS